jgi:glutathione S-transferase
MPFFVRPVARGIADKVRKAFVLPNIRTHLDFLEQELAGRDWFAGATFSAADVQMSFPLEAAQARGGLDEKRPRLMAWLERVHARPAYRQALERGGPYEILGG